MSIITRSTTPLTPEQRVGIWKGRLFAASVRRALGLAVQRTLDEYRHLTAGGREAGFPGLESLLDFLALDRPRPRITFRVAARFLLTLIGGLVVIASSFVFVVFLFGVGSR